MSRKAMALLVAFATASSLVAGVLPGGGGAYAREYQLPVVSLEVVQDTLAPYGDWIYVANYGRVWRPSPQVVGVGFRPYATGGRWQYTDYGWSFESDWNWGWAPFHYGR